MRAIRQLVGAILVSGMGAALLGGCKGNSTSAAMVRREPETAAAVDVGWGKGDVLHADPLSSAIWKDVPAVELGAPTNTDHTTLPCRAKLLVDGEHLYVAFINDRSPADGGATGTAAEGPAGQDRDLVSVFLDNTRQEKGREILQVSAGPSGQASCTWIRTIEPAEPRADGTPDLNHPVSLIPNWKVEGLQAEVGKGEMGGAAVWTVVLAIPIEALPQPFRRAPEAGAHWKFNLMRTVTSDGDMLQANYSPVAVGAQSVSPYRMAELDIGNP